jgi:5-methylcytosine-specific restriction protein A
VSTKRRTNGVWSTKRPLGSNGEKLCYQCLGPLPKGKPYNCSKECSEKWRMRTSPSHVKWLVRARDHGVCALCGIDTISLQNEYYELPVGDWRDPVSEREQFRNKHGIPHGRISSDWWDADHITPVTEGGGECDLSNYRTLCIPCHKKETAALRKRMSTRRIDGKRLPLLDCEATA